MIAGEPVMLDADRPARVVGPSQFRGCVIVSPGGTVPRRRVRPVLSERQRRTYKRLVELGRLDVAGPYARRTLLRLVDVGVATWDGDHITHLPIGG